ncbi:MAG: hypothetical protein KC493_03045 [Bacteriovoracaceae bacterium]|nr:hypothetical protein [Bacteriovoracaceae bacterium]
MRSLLISLFVLILSISTDTFAVNVPKDCFKQDFYCSRGVIKKDPSGRKMVVVSFFATLVAENYLGHEDIVNQFTDFSKWSDYTDGAEEIDVVSSRTVSSRMQSGKRIYTQYARYFMNAPWPVNRMEIVEQSTYRELEPVGNEITAWSFKTDRGFNLKGVKRKDGKLFLFYNEEKKEYLVHVVMEVVPDTKFFKIASKYIQAGITRLFLGMFEL